MECGEVEGEAPHQDGLEMSGEANPASASEMVNSSMDEE